MSSHVVQGFEIMFIIPTGKYLFTLKLKDFRRYTKTKSWVLTQPKPYKLKNLMFELIMFEKKKYSKSVRHIPHIISYFRLKKKRKKKRYLFYVDRHRPFYRYK